jgi:Trehalase-like, N-terminal
LIIKLRTRIHQRYGNGCADGHQSRSGWLCWPDFDSEACLASLRGTSENGIWSLSPKSYQKSVHRYLPSTVLETNYKQGSRAAVIVTDFMPPRAQDSCLAWTVRGSGRTVMRTVLHPVRLRKRVGRVWNRPEMKAGKPSQGPYSWHTHAGIRHCREVT